MTLCRRVRPEQGKAKRMPLIQHSRAMATIAAVLALSAFGGGPALALSQDAQAIVDRVKATTPDLKPVCKDRNALTLAVTSATMALAEARKITPDKASATAAGREAGRYLYLHCS
jgi:hypothetical protein